jgi:hypothetical protein
VCTVSGTALTLVTAGTCSITASQAGSSTFAPAAAATVSFTVSAAPLTAQTISFASPGTQTLGSVPPVLVATASSGLTVTLDSLTRGVCTVSGNTLTLLTAGNCSITANQGGDATYAGAAEVINTFAVVQASQSISFASPGNQTLISGTVSLTASATSTLAVSFTSTTQSVCTVSGNTVSLLTTGPCSITASQAGNTVFAAAAPVSNSFAVTTASQSISFTQPANQTLGTPPAPLSASATSNLTVVFTSNTFDVCTVSGNTLSLVTAGNCSITASQPGNASFAAATPVTLGFTVSFATQSISFDAPANQTMGAPPLTLSATATSGLTVVFTSTTLSTCTVSGNTLTLVAPGSCIIDASQAGNSIFAPASTVSRVITIAPQLAQTITFTAPGDQTLGTIPAQLDARSTSGLTVSLASTTPSVCTVSGTALTLHIAGQCTIEATQAGNATYLAAALVTQSFAVVAAPQTISFTSVGVQTMGTMPPLLEAMASSGLPVVLTSSTASTCTVSGNTLTLVSGGTCILYANQAGGGIYAPATEVMQTITINFLPQIIDFTSPGNQALNANPPVLVATALQATASSGLPVTLASTTPSTCSVSGNTLTLVTVGTCIIDASQAGNGTYAPITVSRVFTITLEVFANGGFEAVDPTDSTHAFGWLAAAAGYSRSTDAHSGSYSAQLASPNFNAAVMLQNSKKDGFRPDLIPGKTTTLTFWAKGYAGGTGNVLFALRYLDDIGNIKAQSFNQFFHVPNTNVQGTLDPNTWTKFTYSLSVPVGATAAFIEFSQGIGPIDAGNPAGLVLIDDLSLLVTGP